MRETDASGTAMRMNGSASSSCVLAYASRVCIPYSARSSASIKSSGRDAVALARDVREDRKDDGVHPSLLPTVLK